MFKPTILMDYICEKFIVKYVILFGLFALAVPVAASEVIVLDFELNDLTNLPYAPQELARIN